MLEVLLLCADHAAVRASARVIKAKEVVQQTKMDMRTCTHDGAETQGIYTVNCFVIQ